MATDLKQHKIWIKGLTVMSEGKSAAVTLPLLNIIFIIDSAFPENESVEL